MGLGTLATALSIDVYGPVCDNAGAIGKGFAIGSACLVGLALFGAFVTRVGNNENADPNVKMHFHPPTGKAQSVNILAPITFSGLLVGAMLPYWFSALTMKSVGMAANAMVLEIERQFREQPELLNPDSGIKPDYDTCIKISTDASLREMIAPGCLVMISPIVVGVFFGVDAVCGLLAGAIVSGVQMAISASNTGGSWDNAKKYIGQGNLNDLIRKNQPGVVQNGVVMQKKSEIYKAAVTGDTVGDPLKDTSGPALNIVMKLMAIVSVVFADFFVSINGGTGLFKIKSV